ncbi:STT3 domain-containing protein [Candidatus Omnitrophota bacterium]
MKKSDITPMNKSHHLITILIILTTCLCGIYFRLYPITVNQRNQTMNTARLTVYVNLKKTIQNNINRILPDAGQKEKATLINNQFKEVIKKESERIEKLVKDVYLQNKKSINAFYFLGSDSFYYYSLTKKLLSEGVFSIINKDGKHFNALMVAPHGHWRKIEAHPYVGFFTYTIYSWFYGNVSLISALSSVPLLLFCFSVCIFVIVCSLLDIDRFTIFISSIFLALSPIFIQRSSFGWYDSDPYNILFQLLALLALVKIARKGLNVFWILFLSLTNSLYALFWQGWIFLPILTSVSFLALAGYRLKKKGNHRITVKQFILYIASLVIFSIIVLTPKGFIDSVADITNIASGFLLFNANQWPDTFLMVGELKVPSISKIIHILGGFAFFSVSLIGLIVSNVKRSRDTTTEQKIILLCFYIACLVMAMNAERFILFLLIPATLYFAIGLKDIRLFFNRKLRAVFRVQEKSTAILTGCILTTLLISPLVYGHAISLKQVPLFNDVWNRVLTQIRLQTPPNSIINSWWPPGHFIKAIAERSVTFDGATINTPQAYWMADALLTDSETEALSILKMLNANGNKATEFLLENEVPLSEAVSLLKKILLVEKEAAKKLAQTVLSEDKAIHLISLTHAPPPPSYCLLYKDLVESTLGLYFVKEWDFNKAEELQRERYTALKHGKIFWRGSKDNIKRAWSIAGGATYIGEESYQAFSTKNTIQFNNGVIFNPRLKEASINMLEGKISGVPQSILYRDNNILQEKELNNFSLKLSILFIDHPGGSYSCIVAPAKILKSVIFRLYYLDGIGLRKFETFIHEENPLLNTKILVYRIVW